MLWAHAGPAAHERRADWLREAAGIGAKSMSTLTYQAAVPRICCQSAESTYLDKSLAKNRRNQVTAKVACVIR